MRRWRGTDRFRKWFWQTESIPAFIVYDASKLASLARWPFVQYLENAHTHTSSLTPHFADNSQLVWTTTNTADSESKRTVEIILITIHSFPFSPPPTHPHPQTPPSFPITYLPSKHHPTLPLSPVGNSFSQCDLDWFSCALWGLWL